VKSSNPGRLRLVHGSFVIKHDEAQGVDAVVMLETIEHVDPERLSALERTVSSCSNLTAARLAPARRR
jgi:hypothetical protein